MSDRVETAQSAWDQYVKARRRGVSREQAEAQVNRHYATWAGPLPAAKFDAWESELEQARTAASVN